MDNKQLRIKLDYIERMVDRIEYKLKPKEVVKLSEGVQHSIIWASCLILLAIFVCCTIIYLS